MNIKETLRGTKGGKIQSCGIMQVIPIILEEESLEEKDLISPNQARFSTTGYGQMRFVNKSDKTLLVPCHTGYIVKEEAQNHAMSESGLVGPDEEEEFDNARCIQQSQGGYISEDQHEMMILPMSLRESALKKRKRKGCSELWEDISSFNAKLGLDRRGHLEIFFNKFEKELDEFVTQFEIVRNQIGAIILINGEVVGIERAPSREYWKDIWQALIRECYGSLAIEVEKTKRAINPDKYRVKLGKSKGKTLKDILVQVKKSEESEKKKAKKIIASILSLDLNEEEDGSKGSYSTFTVTNKNFTGQILKEGEEGAVVYASLFAKEGWEREAKRKIWEEASEFTL